jgi:hypothetical protein
MIEMAKSLMVALTILNCPIGIICGENANLTVDCLDGILYDGQTEIWEREK